MMDDFIFGILIGSAVTALIIGALVLGGTELQRSTCLEVTQAEKCILRWVPQ